MDQFLSIRPYQDHEVEDVLESLINNFDVLKALIGLQYPKYFTKIPLFKLYVKQRLKYKARNIKTINDYQDIFKDLMDRVVDESISNFSVNGISKLDNANSYLFISNHRDISLDAALLNLSLYKSNHKTFNIAVGNNLMEETWASDLMRLNKSFIIHRSGGTKKEIYKSLLLASQFIQKTIFEINESVWIAQKQGRAKDGLDETDPALLKMIHLNKRKSHSVAEHFNSLNLVAVSISYELDPNDRLKAIELNATDENIIYEKKRNEDLNSIANGITGLKGNVSINLSEPLNFEAEVNYDDIAEIITNVIIKMYELHPTNYAAASMLGVNYKNKSKFSLDDINKSKQILEKRMNGLGEGACSKFLEQYANPVMQKIKLNKS